MTTLIGTNPDQVPVNSMLGGMAYQDPDSINVKDFNSSGTANIASLVSPAASITTLTNTTANITTANITNVSYTGTLTGGTGVINIGSGQIYKDASGNVSLGGSGALKINEGTTAQRPASPQEGMIRKNSTLGVIEGYSTGEWFSLQGGLLNVQVFTDPGASTYTPTPGTRKIIVECVGGGGGGVGVPSVASGYKSGGSGGWGGSYAKSLYTSGFSGTTVTVGAGGAGGSSTGGNGSDGGTTSFGALISCPGGAGGLYLNPTNSPDASSSFKSPTSAPTGGNIVMHRGQPGGSFFILNSFVMPLNGGATAIGSWGDHDTVPTGYGAGAPSRYQLYGSSAVAGKPGSGGAVIIYEYS